MQILPGRQLNKWSKADIGPFQKEQLVGILSGKGALIAGNSTDVSQAFAVAVLATETVCPMKIV